MADWDDIPLAARLSVDCEPALQVKEIDNFSYPDWNGGSSKTRTLIVIYFEQIFIHPGVLVLKTASPVGF